MAKDPYRYFRIEARDLRDQLAKGALDLEKAPEDTAQVARLLRFAHTLKGAARVVKQPAIAELAHAMEDSLAGFREPGSRVPRSTIDRLLDALDRIGALLAQLPPAEGTPATAATESTSQPLGVDAAEVDGLLAGLGEIGAELSAVRRTLTSLGRAHDLAGLAVDQGVGTRGTDRQRGERRAPQIKARSMAQDALRLMTGAQRELEERVERMDRELRQARDAAERLRLVAAASMFNALERTARDAAHSVGRQVVFEAGGASVRLDAQVLERVQNALIQLVRNAVAHGIEPEAERSAAGKPAQGRVSIEVARRGLRVLFRCRDDGRGVNLEAVRRAAQRKGVAAADHASMSAGQLLRLLLEGGITTSHTVTELAGRGVGLDVVREAMQQVNGSVAVETTTGRGTTVELQVPVSLAALDALIARCGEQIVAIPLDAVQRTVRLLPEAIARTPDGDAIEHAGSLVPLVALKLEGARGNPGADASGAARERSAAAVIVRAGETSTSLAVDQLLGTEAIVLRPLPASVLADALVLGTYLDAEGYPRLVLDPAALQAALPRVRTPIDTARPMSHPILIIDDSLTTRMLETSILESAGYAVESAASAVEALEMARNNHYALCLVDVEMPVMDGFGFIERARAEPLLREVPCVLVTSRDTPEDRRRGEAVGARAYIVKGEFDQVEFLERVAELVQR